MAGQRPYLAKQHKLKFAQWLQEKLIGVNTGCRLLAMGPSATVSKYQAYEINAYTCDDGGRQHQQSDREILRIHRRDLEADLWPNDGRSIQVPVDQSSKRCDHR